MTGFVRVDNMGEGKYNIHVFKRTRKRSRPRARKIRSMTGFMQIDNRKEGSNLYSRRIGVNCTDGLFLSGSRVKNPVVISNHKKFIVRSALNAVFEEK